MKSFIVFVWFLQRGALHFKKLCSSVCMYLSVFMEAWRRRAHALQGPGARARDSDGRDGAMASATCYKPVRLTMSVRYEGDYDRPTARPTDSDLAPSLRPPVSQSVDAAALWLAAGGLLGVGCVDIAFS